MDVAEMLEKIYRMAMRDEALRKRLLYSRGTASPLKEFCRIAQEMELPLYEMDIIEFGETSYAAMKRSTNGGGENSPQLCYEDDAYELFLSELEERRQANETFS